MTAPSQGWRPSLSAQRFRARAIPHLRVEAHWVAIDVALGVLSWAEAKTEITAAAFWLGADALEPEAGDHLANWLAGQVLDQFEAVAPFARRTVAAVGREGGA